MFVFSICRDIPLVVVDGVILWLACEEYAAMLTNPSALHASHNRIFAHKFVKLRFGLLLNLPLPFNVFPITRVRTQSNWSDYDTNTRSCRSTTYPWAE